LFLGSETLDLAFLERKVKVMNATSPSYYFGEMDSELLDDSQIFDEIINSNEENHIFVRRSMEFCRDDLTPEEMEIAAHYGGAQDMDAIEQVLKQYNIPLSMRDALERKLAYMAEAAQRDEVLANLPAAPVRDIRPYEGIVAYIKSPEGLGPWHEAGVLTRPLIGKLSPRAYTSLSNWLKHPRHNLEAEGLNIPGRSEIVDKEIEGAVDMGLDVTNAGRIYRRNRATGRNP